MLRRLLLAVLALPVIGCAPKAAPLAGAPAPVRIPDTRLPETRQRMVFRWVLEDQDFNAQGEGVARIAPPDSARLDFFLAGGLGSGRAVLLGDTIFAPGGDLVERFLPPPALMWASLGRLAVPPAADTVARVDGETLRADIGRDPTWRATFTAGRLVRLERIEGGRIREWIARGAGESVRYEHEGSRRSLTLTLIRAEPVADFDASIWNH